MMKTSDKIFVILALLSALVASSQQIDWSRVNSQTAPVIIAMQSSDQLSVKSSGSEVLQTGNQNIAELQINSKTNIIVQQFGDRNSIYFNNSFSSKETKSAVTTQGYNNSIDITGNNSISEGMHLNIKGENMTVFMRNY